MLKITNSLTGKQEIFNPKHEGRVNLYVCGITPYDFAHIGHGRCYVTFDLLYRLLRFLDYDVTYCRNFTDIDDKLLLKAHEEFGDASRCKEVADRFIAAYHQDMKALNCIDPDYQPRVTEFIPQIIQFIQGLIDKGAAYEKNGSVYFKVRGAQNYGKLSKQEIDALCAGSRVHVDDEKEDPLDFALWKKDEPHVSFESPWGLGRPGWHIECSAMSRAIFKDTIDIHGGGMDLIFPHHENEIAQSEALYDEQFVNYWMHNAFVRINQEKMSKSLGNFFTLKQVFEQFDPMVIRFYFLKHHYRGPLDFAFDDIHAAEKAYKKLVSFFADVDIPVLDDVDTVANNLVVDKILDCLVDDMNTSGAFGVIFEKMPVLDNDSHAKALVKYFIVHVLGLTLKPLQEKHVEITHEIKQLMQAREEARLQKNWQKADAIRDQLRDLGVDIHDQKLEKK